MESLEKIFANETPWKVLLGAPSSRSLDQI
jgi:hypothetical protein